MGSARTVWALETAVVIEQGWRRLHHGFPWTRQSHSAVDDADHRVGLGKIAPRLAGGGVGVLGHQAEVVARPEQLFEFLASLLAAADSRQGVEAPERANVEGGHGRAEIVGLLIAQHMRAGAQDLFDPLDGGNKPGIVGPQESDLAHQQHAGIQMSAVKAFYEGPSLVRPRSRQYRVANNAGALSP